MGQPSSPPESLLRSRVAFPSLACCRSPSADVSTALPVPCHTLTAPMVSHQPLRSPASLCLPLRSLASLWDPLPAFSISCQLLGSPACPQHPLPTPVGHLPPPTPLSSLSTSPPDSFGCPPSAPRPSPWRRAEQRAGPGAQPPSTEPLSSVSSLEVHFDLLDLSELTDMSDQELAEVFADSDEENTAREAPGGLQPQAVPRAGYLRSPSWTRAREQGREKKHLSDPELPPGPSDAFLPTDRPRDP
ncbi:dysbindin domain-containing protein 1-like isoform X3 [Lathamus discolor]